MFWTVTLALLDGLKTAAELFFLTLIFSLPLGLLIAFGCMNKWTPFRTAAIWGDRLQMKKASERNSLQKLGLFLLSSARFRNVLRRFQPVSWLCNTFVWIIRGTPLLLQLTIIFYGPGMWFDHNIWGSGRMAACTFAFVLNYSCYFSVIFRGGIEGVPVGQREAGQVLGMTKSQIFFKITLLQMVKRIVPPMSNEIITLVKDTSLARIIAISELIKAGERFMKSDGLTWPLFYTGVYYLLFIGILTLLFNYIERKLNYFR